MGNFMNFFSRLNMKISNFYFDCFKSITFPPCARIQSPEKTLDDCEKAIKEKKRGAYIRFGDGDIYLLTNRGIHRNQRYDMDLSKEIEEALSISGEGVIKSLAIHSKKFGIEEFMGPSIHQQTDKKAGRLLSNGFKYFTGNLIYSPVALHYQIVYHPEHAVEFFKFIRSFSPIFVGSENNNKEIVRKLLNTDSIVETLHRNTYTNIASIEDEILNLLCRRNLDYDVVIFSCGATAKALIKRIYNNYDKPVFLFDLGSVVDLFHGRDDWSWVRLSGKNSLYWNSILNQIASH